MPRKDLSEYIGQEFPFKKGDKRHKMKIVDIRSYQDATVQVGDTDILINCSMSSVKKGIVRNPFRENCPIGFMSNKDEYEGCIFRTNQGFNIQVIEYISIKEVRYRFLDTGYEDSTTMQNIIKGEVRNPFFVNKFGGYLGADKTYRSNKFKWLQNIWMMILIRGHEPNREYYHKYHPGVVSYDNTFLDPVWLCYGNFAQWYMSELSKLAPGDYEVDKDLLYSKYKYETNGKKCYSPKYCVLVPRNLNAYIEHMISENSEDIIFSDKIMNLIFKYTEQGCLNPNVSKILYNV